MPNKFWLTFSRVGVIIHNITYSNERVIVTKVNAVIDLKKLGMTIKQWKAFIGDAGEWKTILEYSTHLRDMTQGWIKIGKVSTWKPSDGPFVPGTYAFVYDPKNKIKNPITERGVINIGETTRPGHKRIVMHQLCLRGKKSNMGDKWQSQSTRINEMYGCDILNELNNITIFFRPHHISDEAFESDRTHSSNMETQAHAQYAALWGTLTPGNTRDLPSEKLIEESKKFLTERGYKIFSGKRKLT